MSALATWRRVAPGVVSPSRLGDVPTHRLGGLGSCRLSTIERRRHDAAAATPRDDPGTWRQGRGPTCSSGSSAGDRAERMATPREGWGKPVRGVGQTGRQGGQPRPSGSPGAFGPSTPIRGSIVHESVETRTPRRSHWGQGCSMLEKHESSESGQGWIADRLSRRDSP
jgi:hypothetical protein